MTINLERRMLVDVVKDVLDGRPYMKQELLIENDGLVPGMVSIEPEDGSLRRLARIYEPPGKPHEPRPPARVLVHGPALLETLEAMPTRHVDLSWDDAPTSRLTFTPAPAHPEYESAMHEVSLPTRRHPRGPDEPGILPASPDTDTVLRTDELGHALRALLRIDEPGDQHGTGSRGEPIRLR